MPRGENSFDNIPKKEQTTRATEAHGIIHLPERNPSNKNAENREVCEPSDTIAQQYECQSPLKDIKYRKNFHSIFK